MNDHFTQHALSNEAGKFWLEKIPQIIKDCEKKWSIKVNPPFELSYNYVAPAIKQDGTQVVLKIGFPKDKEFRTEIAALKIFNGESIENILEIDSDNCAILIERVVPGVPLSTLENDEEATIILASVMKKLWKPLPDNHAFITVGEWSQAILDYQQKYGQGNGPLPQYLVDKAAKLFDELITTSDRPVLVHGDLHHDNVLASNRSGWLAIDPKGIAAERAYETTAMIRNPYEKMKDIDNIESIIYKRIMILSKELELDPKRIHKWCIAQSVLSAVWNDDTSKGSEHSIKIAEVLDKIKL